VKYSVCNELFDGWGIEETIRAAAEIGFDAVEIAPYTLSKQVTDISKERRREVRRMAEDSGIEIAGLHWVLVGPDGLHINSADASVRARTQDYLLALVECCHDLGGKAIVFGSPNQRKVAEGLTRRQAWDYAKETLLGAACGVEGTEVRIGLEPLRAEMTDFVNTAEEACRFVDEANHPHLRVTLDCYAMSGESVPIPAIIRSTGDRVCHFHANDDTRREPGSGSVDFSSIGRALREIEYPGYVSIEVFEFERDPKAMAERGLRRLKEAFGP
jgi:sugar phosphate isomerase/epimerase